MNKKSILTRQTTDRILTRLIEKSLVAAIFAGILLCGVSVQAQTTEAWASASDNYTNGPAGSDWLPPITDSITNWPNNFNGSALGGGAYIVIITNNGTCNYAGSPAGDPNYTNIINDLVIGGGNGTGGGGVTNAFIMSGGSLMMVDTNGPEFSVGGNSTGGKLGGQTTNYFTMTGGTLISTNSLANFAANTNGGGNAVGLGTNSMGTANFNGGTVILSDLTVGGHGVGIANFNGANVTITATAAGMSSVNFNTAAKGAGTLNLLSGTLNVTNGQIDFSAGALAGLSSIFNMSGGTLNCSRIQYGTGTANRATNIFTLSGGTINLGSSGYGRNGATSTNRFIMSGGTISCLPGANPNLSSLITTILTNGPGPGVVTYASLAGQTMLLPPITGIGNIILAGPGIVSLSAWSFNGSTTINGGIASLGAAGSIAGPIIIAGGATFDLSELVSTYTLASGQMLSNSTSTATINGSLNTGSGILSLLYASGSPSLTLTTNSSANTNSALATLTLSASTTININNSGPALASGNYLIISTNSPGAAVAGVPPGLVTVVGGGMQAGNTASLAIINSQLYLVVAALPAPPAIGSQFPMPYTNVFALYAGANPTFTISASSASSISYQWYTNGVGVSGATNASLTLNNVHSSFSNYCIVTNIGGSVTSMVWSALVLPDPTNSTGGLAPYPQSVLALNPIGYWRMNDTNLDGPDNQNGDNGYICHDYAGGNDGIYTNLSLGNTGYNPIADPSDTSAQFGQVDENNDFGDSDANSIAGINFASPTGTSAAFTVEAWVSGYEQTYGSAGVVTLGYGNGGEQFCFDCGAANDAFRFFFRDASGASHNINSTVAASTIPLTLGPWYHLVGVVDEITNQSMTFYINGAQVGSVAVPAGSGVLSSTRLMTIGARPSSIATNLNLQFEGNINDVAVFNYALSSSQVLNEYVSSGTIAPFFTQLPPTNVDFFGLTNLVIPAMAAGSGPLGYYWHDVNGGTNVATGTTNGITINATLTVTNIPLTWNGDMLELTVSNAYGSTNVFVTLTNLPPIVVDAWTNIIAPDYFTNNADWSLGTPTNQDEVAITNGGTVLYIAGNPNPPYSWTNSIDQLWMGEGVNGTGGSVNNNGGGTNVFIMSGGSLTILDGSGNDFAIGGHVTPGTTSIPSTNIFTMTDGTLNATNSTGANWIGLASNSVSTVNFNGGTANLSTLYISGCGSGTVNINGGTVNVVSSGNSPVEIGAGTRTNQVSSTLNVISGVLNVTNNSGRSIALADSDSGNTLNVSGGTVYASGLSFGNVGSDINPGNITNSFNLSGGTVYLGSGTVGRNGAASANSAWFSGGTVSTLPGQNSSWSGLVAPILTNSPGPGTIIFAPQTGTTFTLVSCSGPGNLNSAGPGQFILTGAGTYTGNTTISGGTMSLGTNATLANSRNIIVSAVAAFDVSQQATPFTLSSGQTLANSGSTAVLSGSLNSGSGGFSLTYGSGTPSFSIVSNGVLTLAFSTSFTINNTGPALAAGNYLVISTNGTDNSIVGGTMPFCTVNGGGIAPGLAPSLTVSNNELYLVVGVSTVNTNPTNIVFSVSGNQMTLTWPSDHTGWLLQAQTNRVSVGISTNWANVGGSTTTNQVVVPISLTNGCVFYRLVYP